MLQSMGELERDGLQLPAEDRAKLAVSLLCSLYATVDDPKEVEEFWVVESEKRSRRFKLIRRRRSPCR